MRRVVGVLFPCVLPQPDRLRRRWADAVAAAPDEEALARMVSDYIAGMTDRFALQEHARLFGSDLRDYR